MNSKQDQDLVSAHLQMVDQLSQSAIHKTFLREQIKFLIVDLFRQNQELKLILFFLKKEKFE